MLVVREEVRWWLELGQKNLRRAERAMEDTDYPEAVFWCHQAVEFALKGFVLFKGELPIKTHNLSKLLRQAHLDDVLPKHEITELSPYYSISRYPDILEGIPEVEEETAERFFELAKRVLALVKRRVGLERS